MFGFIQTFVGIQNSKRFFVVLQEISYQDKQITTDTDNKKKNMQNNP